MKGYGHRKFYDIKTYKPVFISSADCAQVPSIQSTEYFYKISYFSRYEISMFESCELFFICKVTFSKIHGNKM